MRTLAAGLILLLGGQEPADRVRVLIENLGNDEIAVCETAEAELMKLGRAALASAKKAIESAKGEAKTRLERIVRRLEREAALAEYLAPALRVTLSAKDRLANEVFEDLRRQSGISVEGADLAADTRLSFEVKDVHVARAVDELCRAHGKLMYAWSLSRVRIYPDAYRKLPLIEHGPFVLVVTGFSWTAPRGPGSADSRLWFQGGIVGPTDRIPHIAAFDLESALDDQGTDLRKPMRPDGLLNWSSDELESGWRLGSRVFLPLAWSARTPPHADATKLTEFRGRARLHAILASDRPLSVKNPAAPAAPVSRDGTTLELRTWSQ